MKQITKSSSQGHPSVMLLYTLCFFIHQCFFVREGPYFFSFVPAGPFYRAWFASILWLFILFVWHGELSSFYLFIFVSMYDLRANLSSLCFGSLSDLLFLDTEGFSTAYMVLLIRVSWPEIAINQVLAFQPAYSNDWASVWPIIASLTYSKCWQCWQWVCSIGIIVQLETIWYHNLTLMTTGRSYTS